MNSNINFFDRTLDDISRQNHDQARHTHNMKQHEKDYQQQIKSLELLVTDLKAKYERKLDEADRLAQENYELVQASRAIEKRIRNLEEKEIEAFQAVQKSIEKVEHVLLERDKAMALQHQAEAEIQRLNDKFLQSQTRWREKTDSEISNLRNLWQSEKKQWKIDANNSNLKLSQLQVRALYILRAHYTFTLSPLIFLATNWTGKERKTVKFPIPN